MTDNYALPSEESAPGVAAECERALAVYRREPYRLDEYEILGRIDDPARAGIELGFRAAWACLYHKEQRERQG